MPLDNRCKFLCEKYPDRFALWMLGQPIQTVKVQVVNLILRLLTRRFNSLDEATRSQISALPLTVLEELGEDLLDFTQFAD